LSSEIAGGLSAILARHCPSALVREAEEDPAAALPLWEVLTDAGFTQIAVPEAAGGAGGDLVDACAVLEAAGRYALPLPLGEHALLAAWMLAEAGLPIPPGEIVSAAEGADVSVTARRSASISLERVPYARLAGHVAVIAEVDGRVAVFRLARGDAELVGGANLAGEPRDGATFRDVPLVEGENAAFDVPVTLDEYRMRGAFVRAASMSGALARVSELTSAYANQREQFGRPIGTFQAVGHKLVEIAEHAELVGLAVRQAAVAGANGTASFEMSAAKLVASNSARLASALAHQVHGAIGMTREYDLGLFTRRLASWRTEFGSERHHGAELGSRILAGGADTVWPLICGR
jgi:acyl-CoA dehydrogenase